MKYILLITVFWGTSSLAAQNIPKIVVQAIEENGSIKIHWYPTDPAEWKEGLVSGYTLTRETLTGGEHNSFSPVKVTMKDSTWFKSNISVESGVLYPIGTILFRNDFLKKNNKKNDELQFNYIVYETTLNHSVAEAIGLGYEDKNVTQGASYRYTIRHNKTGLTASLTLKCEDGTSAKDPGDYYHKFQWPNGNSLTDLMILSEPFVLKAIIGKARPKIDSVLLRWAPTTIEIYQKAMMDGFEIWRAKGSDNLSLLTTVKPWTEEQIRQMPRHDTLALLGASYVLNKGVPKGVENANMFDRASLESNYFGFALSAADRSTLAAEIMGLWYVDKTVEFGEYYRYEIRTKSLKPNFPVPDIDVKNVFEPLLAPDNFKTEKKDKTVNLIWRIDNDVHYGSFIIERLNPGDSVFYSLTKQPIVFVRTDAMKYAPYSYIDSLPANNQVYTYRIKGSNAFGEWSEYAYQIGFGRDLTAPKPLEIISGKHQKELNNIRISWTPNTIDKDIAYHQVLMSDNSDNSFAAVSGELLPTDTVFIMDLNGMDIDRSFYFMVNSIDSSGNLASSNSQYVYVQDTIKPDAPIKLIAEISPDGLVTVTWNSSKAHDVTGYYVYYANSGPDLLSLVNNHPIQDTSYSWKIELNSLTKEMFVAVRSIDDNYNKSYLSEILTLRRPDTIAPVKPFLSSTIVNNEVVQLSWKKSSSSDVVKYLIYRKIPSDSLAIWTLIDSVDKDVLQYNDKVSTFGENLNYALIAVDDFNNRSDYSNSGQVFVPFPKNSFVPLISKVETGRKQSVSFKWTFTNKPISGQDLAYSYEIFRSIGSEQVVLYKEVDSTSAKFEETDLEKDVLYNYAVRVRYENGWTGALSEVKSILIK